MSTTSIHVHSATYAPWQEGADERQQLDQSTTHYTFTSARECAEWLAFEGFGTPSVEPGPYDWRTWLVELDPYEHPHSGVLTVRSAHPQTDVHPRLWAAIVHKVSARWTRYVGPYWTGQGWRDSMADTTALQPVPTVDGQAWVFAAPDGTRYQVIHPSGAETVRAYFEWQGCWHTAHVHQLDGRSPRAVAEQVHAEMLALAEADDDLKG